MTNQGSDYVINRLPIVLQQPVAYEVAKISIRPLNDE